MEERAVLHNTMKEFLPLLYQRCAGLMHDQSLHAAEIKKMIIKILFAVFQVKQNSRTRTKVCHIL